MSQNSWPSLTTLCRKKQTTARHADEKDDQGDPSAIVATAEARQRWLSLQLPSPCRVVGGRGWIPWQGGEWIWLFGAQPRLGTSQHSWVDFYCPTEKRWFFSPLIYIFTSSSSLSAFPSSHPSLLNLTSSSIQKGKAIKLLSCLLLLPYSFSLHVVTFLLGPVLVICILYFPVLHHSQWGCGLLNVTRINMIKIRLSMRQWPPTHQALSQTSNKNLGETQIMCRSHRHQLVSLYAKPLFLRYVSTCPALNV